MKNNKQIKNIFFSLCLVLSLTGCKKYIDDAYLDPNRPVTPNVQTVLGPIANNWSRGTFFDSRYIGPYIQNFVNASASNAYDRMGWDLNYTNGIAGGELWRQHYWAVGSSLKYIIETGKESQNWDYVGVAYAMFALSWQTAGDQYGELIVSQAFDNTRLTFDFESQTEAYSLANKYCDSAIRYLQMPGSKVLPGSLLPGDAWIYNGNVARWLRFAYGVKARHYHRFTNKAGYSADSVLKYTAPDLSFQSAADDATIKYAGGTSDQSNFYGQFRGNMQVFRQSTFIADLMNGATGTPFAGVADPRRGTLLWPSGDGVFRGIRPVTGEDATVAATARVPNPFGQIGAVIPTTDTGRFLYRNTAVFPILTYTEIQFLRAEAAFLKGDKKEALKAYTNGINGHFDMIEQNYPAPTPAAIAQRHTAATRAAYLANTAIVPTNEANLTLAMIMNQKYIALYMHGFVETWVDLRRYNYGGAAYPSFLPPTGSSLFPDNSSKLVARFRPRTQVEFQWNVASLTSIGGTNPDYHTKPVWFQVP